VLPVRILVTSCAVNKVWHSAAATIRALLVGPAEAFAATPAGKLFECC
jgi:hypothetical protein